MELLKYNELDVTGVSAQVDKVVARLRAGDFRGADVKKLKPTPYYRARLHDADRLLFRFGVYQGVTYILLLEVIRKHARFGSIDRESNYLVRSVGASDGTVSLLKDTEKVRRDLDDKTRRSARFAVLCLRPEDKEATRAVFGTPLVFSIQESKGLEYEHVIVFNFVAEHGREYNAMYAGLTRAIRNIYIVDKWADHDLFRLLNLECVIDTGIVAQTSSDEEWKREARRLEMQGKTEQADDIRQRILGMQPVPWRVLTPDNLDELKQEALDPARGNKPGKQLLYDYGTFYPSPDIFARLVKLGYNRARAPGQDRHVVIEKYAQDFQDPTFRELTRKLRVHGVDFRNALNQTPLMVAALIGRENPVRFLRGQEVDTVFMGVSCTEILTYSALPTNRWLHECATTSVETGFCFLGLRPMRYGHSEHPVHGHSFTAVFCPQ